MEMVPLVVELAEITELNIELRAQLEKACREQLDARFTLEKGSQFTVRYS